MEIKYGIYSYLYDVESKGIISMITNVEGNILKWNIVIADSNGQYHKGLIEGVSPVLVGEVQEKLKGKEIPFKILTHFKTIKPLELNPNYIPVPETLIFIDEQDVKNLIGGKV